MSHTSKGLTHGKEMPGRALLPRWARHHDAVAARCAVDTRFRLRVMSAEGFERPILAQWARDWAATRT